MPAREELHHREAEHRGEQHREAERQPRATRPTTSTTTVPATVGDDHHAELDLDRVQPVQRALRRSRLERVADAVDRAHEPAPSLRAQPAHVRVDGALAGTVAPAPDVGQQLLARVDDAGPRREQREQVELGRRQMHRLAADRTPARRRIELQRADPHGVAGAAPGAARRGAGAPARGRRARAARTAWSCSRRRRRRARPARRSPPSRAVSISTGTGRSRWTRRQTSRPSIPGSIRSRTTRSGRTRSHSSTPGGPVVGDLDVEALGPQAGGDRRGDHGLVLDHADERCCPSRRVCQGRVGAAHGSCAGLVQNPQ